MPCSRNMDLPAEVLNRLPQAAREMYRKAYKNAWWNYRHAERKAHESLEDVAHGVALASLEACYHRTERGQWVAD